MTEQELLLLAKEASERAYVPYSHFCVGAALECSDGTVFKGCNVENAAYGDTICAERTAIVKAVSEGYTSFRRIAIYGKSEGYCMPCGSCRQVMAEFCRPGEFMVYLDTGRDGEYETYTLEGLLPRGFTPENLKP